MANRQHLYLFIYTYLCECFSEPRLRYLTSVAPLPGSVCVVWTDSLQRMLLLPEAVHTLVSDGGKGAFHQFTVQ